MEKVNVKRLEVLEVIRENRKKHKKEYSEAIKAYRVKAGDLLSQELEKINSGKSFTTYLSGISKPESHIKDYDLSIKMIEMSVDDIVQLEQGEFNQLVNDEWAWKSSFRSILITNSFYNGRTSYSSGTSGVSDTSGTSVNVVFSEDELDDEE